MSIFGYGRADVEKRIGHVSQVGGLRPFTLSDGRANGVRGVDFRTTTGLDFTVLLDRAMDISEARYKGMSLCWRSAAGDANPAFYDSRWIEWLWTFFGGLNTTCGLTQTGGPNTDQGEALGLHGRVSAAPAERVSVREEWESDHLALEVSGVVREARLFGPELEMHRTIRARSDRAGFSVRDRIVNIGARPSPLMLLYHINLGFPLLDDGAEMILPSTKVVARDERARAEQERWAEIIGPATGYEERVYAHTMEADADGIVTYGLINRRLNIGVQVQYRKQELPFFTEWKMFGDREYVLGLEPANSPAIGREALREKGQLVELGVGEATDAGFEVNVVEGKQELDRLVENASARR